MKYRDAQFDSPSARHRHRRSGVLAVAAMASAAVMVVSLSAGSSPVAAFTPPPNRHYPGNLPTTIAHPGSVIVAFKTPVASAGDRVSGNGTASASDVDAINATLAGLNATSVRHLFTSIPADKLAAARAKAEAATNAYVTDFSQVYQVTFAADVNPGEAANQLGKSALVSSAMPDWIYKVPSNDHATLSATQIQQAVAAVQQARDKQQPTGTPDAAALPGSDAYRTDAQSYHDAASDNVTGAAAMIAKKFGQQPAQGEVVTNVSLGTVDDTSTVLEDGQRYIEQAGYPKIPVWLSSLDCDPVTNNCNIVLDPTATNTQDGQGDFLEVDLDFSTMAPPPVGDPRIVNPAPPGNNQLLGEAYGADFRLINPLVNGTGGFLAAFLGSVFVQSPPADVVTASIGDGFGIGGFSDYFFEQESIIHDAVSLLVDGADAFVSISAGDGQTETSVAMNPNGLTGPTDVTTDPAQLTDINDPALWANPAYSYGLTVEPEFVIDSGANDAGANTLNDVFNNSPWNPNIPSSVSHDQHTIETRWTGQQNFHTGFGTRVNVSAPGDDVLMLAQVEDANGIPVDPVSSFPRLIGGSSASSPEIAGAAAVVRQAARLLHMDLTARQVRDLLVATGRPNVTPAFDLDNANIGPALDLTAAVQSLFDKARVKEDPSFARMTVAQRKTVLTYTDFRSSFWSDTPQDPVAGTATIDLSQGLVAPSSRINETLGASGDNINVPITFGVDSLFSPAKHADYRWTLTLGNRTVNVPQSLANRNNPFVRLLPAEIFSLLRQPVTSTNDRVVTVTARNGKATISTAVTFKGQADSTYSHAVPPTFNPVFTDGDNVVVNYDFRGLRDGQGGKVDGGELVVSDIDRTVPQAFPAPDGDVHGFTRVLNGLVGSITLSAADFPQGVGAYGLALRGTKHGVEVPDTTSLFLPLRFAPAAYELPATPKVKAAASLFGPTDPLFYDAADIEPGGSTQFDVTYDVSGVTGATNAIIEFSRPTIDFADALFITGNFTPDNAFVNNFTNPNGDRLDGGNTFGQAGETTNVPVMGTSGTATLDGSVIGLSIPDTNCDSTYQVRVLAADAEGNIVGVASNGSIFSYADFSRDACFPAP
jgi:hypothetical protein